VRLAKQDHRAMLDWQDSAPGVPPEALPRLFERLYRVENSRSRAAGGSGLGLSIARSIAEAHGGHIDASASGLGGVRLLVQLPMADRP
jgi:two-component system, OmpR family, sensor histidine kinase BaeS